MNKIAVFLCFILFFNFSNSFELNDETLDTVYDLLVEVLKGMCQNDKKECATAFAKNKDQLIVIIKEIMEEIKNGEEFGTILMKYSVKLLLIDDIGTKCNIIYILRVINKFQSADGIRDIGETIKNNADELYKYIQVILTGETTEAKLYAVGQILALLFNYYVN